MITFTNAFWKSNVGKSRYRYKYISSAERKSLLLRVADSIANALHCIQFVGEIKKMHFLVLCELLYFTSLHVEYHALISLDQVIFISKKLQRH